MKKILFYFGCIRGAGHYLWQSPGSTIYARAAASHIPGANNKLFECLDGVFAPGGTTQQGVYQVSIIPPVTIVAWHDYTVDSRPGSNSALVGYGYNSAEEIIEAAKKLFPGVMSRQPELKIDSTTLKPPVTG